MARESLPPKRRPPLRGQPCLVLRIWTLRGLVHHLRESPEPLSLSLTSTRERTSDRYDLEVSLISRKQVYDCFPILFPPSYSPNPCHPWFPAVEEMGDNRCVCECVCVCVCVTEREDTALALTTGGNLPPGPCPLGELARCVPRQPVEPPGGCQRVSGMGVDGWEEALTAGSETVFMVQLGGLTGQEGGRQGRGKLPLIKGPCHPPHRGPCVNLLRAGIGGALRPVEALAPGPQDRGPTKCASSTAGGGQGGG